ncbi:ATP-binding cassette domain-containing protein [Paraburkholderia xenovorans]|uniref:ATP-binding cassette domain-containing protein n=1 Tax=Paraburkholderia xenovorans TaxID=36873 RepID=UPI0038BDF539
MWTRCCYFLFSFGLTDLATAFLQLLNCYVEGNELHVVIGPNGAGKTTLFDMSSNWLSRGRWCRSRRC